MFLNAVRHKCFNIATFLTFTLHWHVSWISRIFVPCLPMILPTYWLDTVILTRSCQPDLFSSQHRFSIICLAISTPESAPVISTGVSWPELSSLMIWNHKVYFSVQNLKVELKDTYMHFSTNLQTRLQSQKEKTKLSKILVFTAKNLCFGLQSQKEKTKLSSFYSKNSVFLKV